MRKVILFISGMFFMLISFGTEVSVQSGSDYFTGKWNVIAAGGPGGETQMVVGLERKDGKLFGDIKIGDENAIKFSSTEEKETSVKLYFTSSHGNDIILFMEKKDEAKVVGTLTIKDMDTLNVSGERVVKE